VGPSAVLFPHRVSLTPLSPHGDPAVNELLITVRVAVQAATVPASSLQSSPAPANRRIPRVCAFNNWYCTPSDHASQAPPYFCSIPTVNRCLLFYNNFFIKKKKIATPGLVGQHGAHIFWLSTSTPSIKPIGPCSVPHLGFTPSPLG
jgi:hypothetical protein